MRVPLKWLSDYVPVVLPVDELAHRFALAGLEVASVERSSGPWDHVYVGEIMALDRHPNADRLQLATVDYGHGRATVVTGAPNISVGDRVPFALVGAELVDFHQQPPRKTKLRPAKIRGIESAGMVCSAAELGLGEDHSGILLLDRDTPLGARLDEVLGGTVVELELTPNRGDCLSMLGVAREVAALTGQTYREPEVAIATSGRPAGERLTIEIEDPDLCRRYVGALIEGIRVGSSPAWMQERLAAAGLRPINNVVDVTNYVMLEYGQPLHAFDSERIRGERIVVRRARQGEKLRTLDGVDRILGPTVLVIADDERPVAVAGVMGGKDSEVSSGTTSVLLEAATFDPISVRLTSRGLGLPSEAARRFEKGLPPELAPEAIARAVQLLADLAGGQVAPGWVDCYPRPAAPKQIELDFTEFERLLGIPIGPGEAVPVLERLGFRVRVSGERLAVTVPYRRTDVSIPADVVEEVARVRGYDELPEKRLSGAPPDPASTSDEWLFAERVRDVLVGCGLTEIITYSLVSQARLEKVRARPSEHPLAKGIDHLLSPGVEPLALVNPLSSELSVLRTNAFAQMLETIRSNLRWTERDVQLFEVGRIYHPRDQDLPEERRVLTLGSAAYRSGADWGSRVALDFYDLKGIVEAALRELGLPELRFIPVEHPTFRRGHAAAVLRGDVQDQAAALLGVIGEVGPSVRQAFDLDQAIFLSGLDLDRVRAAVVTPTVRSLPRYPAVYQDLAVVVPQSISADDLKRAILRAGRPLATDAEVFDVYQGERIGTGRRSLAYRITYQSAERTLTDREVADAHARIEAALSREFEAEVRGRTA